jgi:hypothetical protein
MAIGDEHGLYKANLTALVEYEVRLCSAAEQAGIEVVSPA